MSHCNADEWRDVLKMATLPTGRSTIPPDTGMSPKRLRLQFKFMNTDLRRPFEFSAVTGFLVVCQWEYLSITSTPSPSLSLYLSFSLTLSLSSITLFLSPLSLYLSISLSCCISLLFFLSLCISPSFFLSLPLSPLQDDH